MELALLLFIVLLAPLSYFYGVDSRVSDERDRRSWWPGAPRSR